MEPLGLVVLVVGGALFFRLIAGSMDTERIEKHIRDRGWKLIDKSWDPFGPGWFGEKSDRIYEVIYEDEQGAKHRAHVKTSLFTGVYLTNDEVVEASTKTRDLEAENEALRRRVAELEGEG